MRLESGILEGEKLEGEKLEGENSNFLVSRIPNSISAPPS